MAVPSTYMGIDPTHCRPMWWYNWVTPGAMVGVTRPLPRTPFWQGDRGHPHPVPGPQRPGLRVHRLHEQEVLGLDLQEPLVVGRTGVHMPGALDRDQPQATSGQFAVVPLAAPMALVGLLPPGSPGTGLAGVRVLVVDVLLPKVLETRAVADLGPAGGPGVLDRGRVLPVPAQVHVAAWRIERENDDKRSR